MDKWSIEKGLIDTFGIVKEIFGTIYLFYRDDPASLIRPNPEIRDIAHYCLENGLYSLRRR
jgi:hypothetical protein